MDFAILDRRLNDLVDAINASNAAFRSNRGILFPDEVGPVNQGDDTATVQLAVNTAIAKGADLGWRKYDYLLSAPIDVGDGTPTTVSSMHGLNIVGVGAGAAASEFAPRRPLSRLKWIGPTNSTVFKIHGPMSSVNLKGFSVDCNNTSGVVGIDAEHMTGSHWEDVLVQRYKGAFGVTMSAYASPGPGTFAQGANKNTFMNFRCKDAGAGGSGIRIGATAGYTNQMLDIAQNIFLNPDFERDGNDDTTTSCQLSFCDVVSFACAGLRPTSGTLGSALRITPPTGSGVNDSNHVKFPADITFYGNCALKGRIDVDASWAPSQFISFWPFHTGDGEAIPTDPHMWGADPNGRRFGPWALLLQALATPVNNGDMMFQLTDDTHLVVKVKGNDGTVRSVTFNLA